MKLVFVLLMTASAFAAEPKVIPLYPGAAPGSENWNYEEKETIGPQDTLRRISDITHPTLTAYFADPALANGTAVIVCPGGGFRYLAIDHEGTDVAHWLNSLGVTAFVLKYRVMRTGDPAEKSPAKMDARKKEVIPLAIGDGQQAVRLVRSHAADWSIAPDRIVILGFSAGGYIAAGVALHHDAESRPNYVAPIYPGTPEDVAAPADAPPMFIVHADDDKTVAPIDHSVRLYESWKKVGAPVEIHIYS